jgi:hypothetical protein
MPQPPHLGAESCGLKHVRSQLSAETLLSVLSSLECELHEPRVRRDRARLEELLHPSFSEFGRSGNAYTKTEIIALLLDEQESVRIHAQDFRVQILAEGVALLTYKSAHVTAAGVLERHSLRSSVWKQGALGWQALFHQGTATAGFAQNAT